MLHGIPYVWGAKPDPKKTTDKISGSDCSGWSRYLLGRQEIDIPEGSAEQREWMREKKLVRIARDHYSYGKPSLTVWFIAPVAGEHAGHVWFVLGGYNTTMECFGGHGVGSRPAYTKVLVWEVAEGFILPIK